jgi:D-lyxose ketol-isomerase
LLLNEPELAIFRDVEKVPKLWGCEYVLVNTPKYCLKFLKITPGYRCSVHAHKKKDETFIGWSGTVQLNIHNDLGIITKSVGIDPGAKFRIAPMIYHSFQAHNQSWILEVSTSHDDRDVVRLEESRQL